MRSLSSALEKKEGTIPDHTDTLVRKAIWLRKPSGYKSRLVTKTVWLKNRLVANASWLQMPSGYESRLVTKAVWLRRPSGYKGLSGYESRLVTKGHLVTKAIWVRVAVRVVT